MEVIQSQLTVIGAGPAGVCAAISAARQGIDTVLICERPVLGGNSSSEFRVWTRGATGAGNLFAEEMGIWGELKLLNLYRNPEANPIFWDETLLDAVLAEKKLRLFLNTTVFKMEQKNQTITSVSGVQLGTEKELTFCSDYYIDSTGDGSIAEKAGMKYTVGTTKGTLGSSILYYTKKVDHAVSFVAPSYAYSMDKIKQLMNHGGRIISEKMSGSDCWWFEYGGTLNTIQDEQEITIELKRLVLGVWNYIKNSGNFHAENYTLEWIGNIAGKRESRRMITKTQLKASDIYAGMHFLDAGFYGGWYIDSHPPGGITDSAEENCIQRPVNIYPIPLRCLYGDVKNLVLAGRIIGTDSEAFFSSRVMNTCALSGQAAAAVAANCILGQKQLTDLQGKDFIEIQQELHREDMFIPGIKPEDPQDVLLHAKAEASSTTEDCAGESIGELNFQEKVFAVFPARKGKAVISIRSTAAAEIEAELYTSALPNRYVVEGTPEHLHWKVHAGQETIQLEIPEQMSGKFAVLNFKENNDVYLLYTERTRVGYLCGTKESSKYHEPCITYTEAAGDVIYSPDNITDGYTRIWKYPHAWLPSRQDAHPWVKVTLHQEEALKELRIFLDPDLSMELVNSRTEHWRKDHKYTKREGMPEQLIRQMMVEAELADGTVKEIAVIKDNCKRLLILPIQEKQKIKSIQLNAIDTWGHEAPVIFEISGYVK